MKKFLLGIVGIIFMGLGGPKCFAQLPVTEVFMLETAGNERLESIQYLTGFNPNAYNNQAVFAGKNEILLTCELSDNQTDIVQLQLNNKKWKRLTATGESEYSPRIYNDNYFTTVRVEKDGETQKLWEYPMHLKSQGEELLPHAGKIGYYYFLGNFRVALFLINKDQFDLSIGNLRNNQISKKVENIGRCFQKNKTGALIYLDKSGKSSKIKSFNVFNGQIQEIAPALEGSEDFVLWGAEESILMAKGPQIFRYRANAGTWILLFDLSEYGLMDITRLDVDGNRILLVNKKSL